jgi:hypothetical protein
MYGLVNVAIEKLVQAELGDDAWKEVCEEVGLNDFAGFMALKSYPDELTYNLVGAVSKKSGLPPEQILEMFGYYWIDYTKKEGYTDYLYLGGETLDVFLGNLNKLHTQVKQLFPDLRPPSFSIEKNKDKEFHLFYRSEREGLTPMVVGLLKGLADYFNETIEINLLEKGQGVVKFEIKIL